jgi:hypothetical protein
MFRPLMLPIFRLYLKLIEYLYTICGVFVGCGEGVCVGARSRLCQRWVHSLGILMGVLILVIHTLFLVMY